MPGFDNTFCYQYSGRAVRHVNPSTKKLRNTANAMPAFSMKVPSLVTVAA